MPRQFFLKKNRFKNILEIGPGSGNLTKYILNKKPKKFTGGELFFPEYDYELTCDDNSLIMFPGWVEHGVKKVSIKDSDYHEGNGRYCISSFINNVGR